MGKYTAHDDPIVEQTVTAHLSQIVNAIRARMEPHSIILYGSFGRGEGSVMLDDGRLAFLSDYEIAVVTPSPFYRGAFAALSRQLTAEMGLEVSISWMRPGRLRTNQPQNLAWGRAKPTISMYEIKAGGQTLYGQDLLSVGPIIDPRQLSVQDGIRLLINRMAEALPHRVHPISPQNRLEAIRWINKLILACNEAMLLLWQEYHYSYAERGRRFAAASSQRQAELPADMSQLAGMVQRATCFKLRPALDLYPETLHDLWPQVAAMMGTVFRYVVGKELGITFDSCVQFPEQFLNHPRVQTSYNLYRLWPLPAPLDQKLINIIKFLRQRRRPPRSYLAHPLITANLIIFALIPLMFLGWSKDNAALTGVNAEARRWLNMLGYQERVLPDPQAEWHALYQHLLWGWKNFCYN